jgi:beta-glucosidase
VSEAGGEAALSPDGAYETRPDVAVVVFGETPYAEFQGDIDTLDFLPEEPLAVLRRLQAQGIPTVSVFLSGRPMWVNPEINASDAFVAAWLPGTEGAGVADVIVGDAAGRPRHDFRGVLGFSWPRDAVGQPLNRGEPGYNPQFAYGYGLSYARPARVGQLSEDSGVAARSASVDMYLVDGRVMPPWSLALEDSGGQARVGDEKSFASPRGGVLMTIVDDLAQESGRRFVFGDDGGQALIWGGAVDLSRQANGEMALSFRYRVDGRPQGRLTLGLGQAAVDLTSMFGAVPLGEWRTIKVRLSCFREAGADLSAVERPFQLVAEGPAAVSVSEIRLASNEADTVCPASAPRP